METVHVIIAELSQLVRLGINGIVRQMGIPLVIREVTEAEKLPGILRKDHSYLFITSSSFIGNCSADFLKHILSGGRKIRRVLIRNRYEESDSNKAFDEIIEPEDNEKAIYRKLEKQFRVLLNTSIPASQPEEISDREKEVLQLVALGMTNKEIAGKLFISSHTVITHRKNITAKLGIKTIAGLTVYAVIHKLIAPEQLK